MSLIAKDTLFNSRQDWIGDISSKLSREKLSKEDSKAPTVIVRILEIFSFSDSSGNIPKCHLAFQAQPSKIQVIECADSKYRNTRFSRRCFPESQSSWSKNFFERKSIF